MKKVAFAVLFSMCAGALSVGCSSNDCEALVTKQKDCCNKEPDATTKEKCLEAIDAQNLASTSKEICDAAGAAFMCAIQ